MKRYLLTLHERFRTVTRRTDDLLSGVTEKTLLIQNAAILAERAADALEAKYKALGYAVQRFRFVEDDKNGIFLQIRNTCETALNTLKLATGLQLAACLKILPIGDDLHITACQGRWIDKVIVNIVSWFVLTPLFFTSLFGFWKQKALLNAIERDVLEYFANHTERGAEVASKQHSVHIIW